MLNAACSMQHAACSMQHALHLLHLVVAVVRYRNCSCCCSLLSFRLFLLLQTTNVSRISAVCAIENASSTSERRMQKRNSIEMKGKVISLWWPQNTHRLRLTTSSSRGLLNSRQCITEWHCLVCNGNGNGFETSRNNIAKCQCAGSVSVPLTNHFKNLHALRIKSNSRCRRGHCEYSHQHCMLTIIDANCAKPPPLANITTSNSFSNSFTNHSSKAAFPALPAASFIHSCNNQYRRRIVWLYIVIGFIYQNSF